MTFHIFYLQSLLRKKILFGFDRQALDIYGSIFLTKIYRELTIHERNIQSLALLR